MNRVVNFRDWIVFSVSACCDSKDQDFIFTRGSRQYPFMRSEVLRADAVSFLDRLRVRNNLQAEG